MPISLTDLAAFSEQDVAAVLADELADSAELQACEQPDCYTSGGTAGSRKNGIGLGDERFA